MKEKSSQPQRPSPAPERKTGDILTSLGLTSRSRVNPGHYLLWVDRSYRVRIHQIARDYEVDDILTGPIRNCDICTKKEHGVPGATPGPETVDQERLAQMSQSVNVVNILREEEPTLSKRTSQRLAIFSAIRRRRSRRSDSPSALGVEQITEAPVGHRTSREWPDSLGRCHPGDTPGPHPLDDRNLDSCHTADDTCAA